MYYGGFTYTEAHYLPIEYRQWFIQRINREIEKSAEGGKTSQGTRSPAANTPMHQAMNNSHRTYTPARMMRA